MSKYRVLLIDDDYAPDVPLGEGNYMRYDVEELERKDCEVLSANSWDTAKELLENEKRSRGKGSDGWRAWSAFDLVLLDISMPTGELFTRRQTAGGLLTGLMVSKELSRRRQPHVILSNMIGGPVPDDFEQTSEYLRGKFLKPNTTPKELVELVTAFLLQR